jgi:histidine triad (HIT) family protein
MADCVFCRVVSRETASLIVYEVGSTLAFLDHRPLFPGHVLLVPKAHHETMAGLPADLAGSLFAAACKLAIAVEAGMRAQGTFVAVNNRVSQSVPHLHVHIVPRTKGDGLKGFFWPRRGYSRPEDAQAARDAIAAALP